MADEQDERGPVDQLPIEVEWHSEPARAARTDLILSEFLKFMEVLGVSFDISLITDGFVVTGTPVSPARFFEGQEATINRLLDEQAERHIAIAGQEGYETLRGLTGWFRQLAEDVRPPDFGEYSPESEALAEEYVQSVLSQPRQHVMLHQASILTPEGFQIDIPWWRGRLDHVSGWWLGRTEKHPYAGRELTSRPHQSGLSGDEEATPA